MIDYKRLSYSLMKTFKISQTEALSLLGIAYIATKNNKNERIFAACLLQRARGEFLNAYKKNERYAFGTVEVEETLNSLTSKNTIVSDENFLNSIHIPGNQWFNQSTYWILNKRRNFKKPLSAETLTDRLYRWGCKHPRIEAGSILKQLKVLAKQLQAA